MLIPGKPIPEPAWSPLCPLCGLCPDAVPHPSHFLWVGGAPPGAVLTGIPVPGSSAFHLGNSLVLAEPAGSTPLTLG